jgi:hypothetical protein
MLSIKSSGLIYCNPLKGGGLGQGDVTLFIPFVLIKEAILAPNLERYYNLL